MFLSSTSLWFNNREIRDEDVELNKSCNHMWTLNPSVSFLTEGSGYKEFKP